MRRQRQQGQTIVETALGITVFLLFVMGVIDLGRAGYTYNALSNLAREASHYAQLEYTSDGSSPCYWGSFDNADCLGAVKSYVFGLQMAPGLTTHNVSVSMTINCGEGTACTMNQPISVAVSTRFQPVSTALIGIGPFDINASSTDQFDLPPNGTATPTPTPTTTPGPEGPVGGLSVTPDSGCSSNCEVFDISWTPPSNIAALGHYDIFFGSAGAYTEADPVPAQLGGSNTTFTTVDIGNQTHAVCFEVASVFQDGSQWPATSSWHDSGSSPPVC
ncbi:MAG TPA: TadE family protein [Chloroflexota bacterium]|nr:TadE family protein [Chloroflexota bacterium]